MHIKLQNGKILNTMLLNDVRQGYKNKKAVILYMTNGLSILEGIYKSEDEAKGRVEEIKSSLI